MMDDLGGLDEDLCDDRRVLIVGDSCGKLSLAEVFLTGKPLPEQTRGSFNKAFRGTVKLEWGRCVPLEIKIAPCDDHYSAIRSLEYSQIKVILLCFAIDDPNSLKNVSGKWYPEIEKYVAEDVPIILVGNKLDLRSDVGKVSALERESPELVSSEEGRAVAEKIGAAEYFECSAMSGENVKELFQAAAEAILKKDANRKFDFE